MVELAVQDHDPGGALLEFSSLRRLFVIAYNALLLFCVVGLIYLLIQNIRLTRLIESYQQDVAYTLSLNQSVTETLGRRQTALENIVTNSNEIRLTITQLAAYNGKQIRRGRNKAKKLSIGGY
jgi:uncharacterized protein (DUF58 family)